MKLKLLELFWIEVPEPVLAAELTVPACDVGGQCFSSCGAIDWKFDLCLQSGVPLRHIGNYNRFGEGEGELVRKDDLLMPSTDCEAAQT